MRESGFRPDHMRLLAYITFVVCVVFSSGCSTAGQHLFPSSKNPVYSGTRYDVHNIVHKDYPAEPAWVPVASCVDLPFSFVADTFILPFDIEEWSELSVPDPLKDWTYKPFPVVPGGRFGSVTTNTLEKAVVDDYQDYIKKNGLSVAMGVDGYYEDGKGHIGIKFEAFVGGNESWDFALIYDSKYKRIKTVKFNRARYMC